MHGVQEMFKRVLVGKPEENVPLERSTYRWKDINRTNQENRKVCVDFINIAQDRDKMRVTVNKVMKFQVT